MTRLSIFRCIQTLLIFLSIYFHSYGQMPNAYPEIRLTSLPDQLPPNMQVGNWSVDNTWQWRKDLMRGQLDSNANRSVYKFQQPFVASTPENVLIFPAALSFQFVTEEVDDLILVQDTTFFCNISQSQLVDTHVHFQWPAGGGWFLGSAPSIQVDFGDGLGWRELEEGAVYDIHYDDASLDRTIQFKTIWEGKNRTFSTQLKGLNCQSIFPSPHVPNWPVTNPAYPWQIESSTPWGEVKANAYTLWSADGVFDQPFIFVEGIDFGTAHGYYQNGTFGWCQFTGGDYSGSYSMMNESPVFLSELRNRGYDLILLDFYDGATDIRANAEVLIQLIELCNQYKEGNQGIILAGASMGGQVARCALGKMEQTGISHCVSAYISLDSPHQGANIPLGLQAMLSFMSNYNSNAEAFIEEGLTRTAAQQLLLYQFLDSEGEMDHPWKREEYMQYLESLPFPSQCYSMAIANGNFQNEILPTNPFLLEENCDASNWLAGNELELRCFTLPGDLTNTANGNGQTVIADLTFTTVNWNGIIPDVTQDHQLLMVPSGLPAMDCAPGGYRTSMDQMVQSLNASEDFTESCGTIGSDQYLAKHCFVPSASAWAVPMQSADMVSAWEQTPFDAVYAPFATNEQHSALTAVNAEWVLNQLDQLTEDLSPLSLNTTQEYNFGGASDVIFPILDIHGNQKISIQKQIPLHGGVEPAPAAGSHRIMKTIPQCEGDVIHVREKSSLEIGDPNGLSTATLVVRGGCTLRIYEKGICWIHPGSQLIVEEGGKILIDGEGGLRNNNGTIVLKAGGELIYQKGFCTLENEFSTLQLKGGLVHLLKKAKLDWTPSEEWNGKIEVYPSDYVEFLFDEESSMYLQGRHQEDTIYIIKKSAYSSDVANTLHHMVFRNGLVVIENNATFQTQTDWTCNRVHFYSMNAMNEGYDLITQYNGVDFYHVQMDNVKWHSRSYDVFLSNVVSESNRDWWVENGKWEHWTGEILGHGILFENMQGETLFDNVILTGEGASHALHHTGEQTLTLDNVRMSDYITGVIKSYGTLRISCSEFGQLHLGTLLQANALLMANEGWGNNAWLNNDQHLMFDSAAVPNIQGGGNLFSWALSGPYATGTLVGSDFSNGLNWSGNEWVAASFTGNTLITAAENGNIVPVNYLPSQSFLDCTENEMWSLKKADIATNEIFPNPSLRGQTIQTAQKPHHIWDASGKEVLNQVACYAIESAWEIESGALAPGMYWIQTEERTMKWILLP